MSPSKIPRSLGTHDGPFHADEVTACALLLLFDQIDLDKIIRTRDMPRLANCEYVCDVGGIYDPKRKLFDHHQAEYTGDLSSAGMILKYLKETQIISEKEYEFFNHTLVWGVDAHDNGKEIEIPGVCTYSHIIASFTPLAKESEPNVFDSSFKEALSFAKGLLERFWKRYQYIQSCQQMVAEVMARSDKVMVFDENIPWMDSFFELGGNTHPAVFIIMPSGRHWKLRGIPPNLDHRMQVRLPLPQEWAGLSEEDLKRISGIPGAIFCHKGRFISVWETREDALKALECILAKKS